MDCPVAVKKAAMSLELITGVHRSAESCLHELTRIHQFVYRAMEDELLWVASMPCRLPSDAQIPIARYGSSNIGRAKSVYRVGIGHRYGRRMQAISGIHYNWSMPGISTSLTTISGNVGRAQSRRPDSPSSAT